MLTKNHTENHPVLTVLTKQGWKSASKLLDGDVVMGIDENHNISEHAIKIFDDGIRGQRRIIIKG